MLIARISSERGDKLDMLVEKLLCPSYNALYPLLVEAARANVIKAQRLDVLYFMILNAVTMSVSYRHVLGYFNNDFEDMEQLKEDMARFLIVNFLESSLPGASKKGAPFKKKAAGAIPQLPTPILWSDPKNNSTHLRKNHKGARGRT
jgi:hypothetical protein